MSDLVNPTARDIAALRTLYPELGNLLDAVALLRTRASTKGNVEKRWATGATSTRRLDAVTAAHHKAETIVFGAYAIAVGEIEAPTQGIPL